MRFNSVKRKVQRFLGIVSFVSMLSAKTFTLQEFFKEVETNSMELIGKKADFKSRLNEQRSVNAWDFPYIYNETSMVKNFQGIVEAQTQNPFNGKTQAPMGELAFIQKPLY